jgi:predicted dehydrogenase
MTIDAAQRGVHVFMEKPLCRTVAEADAIVDALERTHTKLVVAHPARYTPEWRAAKQAIDQGRIGRILEMRGRGKEDARGGGEDLWVLGSHILDMMIGLKGRAEWCFAEVRQAGRPIGRSDVKPGNEGYTVIAGDAIHAMYGFPDGVIGTFDSVRGAGGQPSRFALQVFGTKGVLEVTSAQAPIVRVLDDPSWSPGRSGKSWKTLVESNSKAGAHAGHVGGVVDLLECIEQRREPLCGAKAGRDVVEMITATFASQVAGAPVPLPIVHRTNPLGSS